jgi:protein-S-isoprenylcysteine O-methyltransferase Ste14
MIRQRKSKQTISNKEPPSEDTQLLQNGSLNDMDSPFTTREKIKWTFAMFLIPWFLYLPFIYAGALLRISRPWFPGLWLSPLILMIAYSVCWIMLIDHPRILRERASKNEFSKEKPGEPWKETVAQKLITVTLLGSPIVSAYDAAGRALDGNNAPVAIYAAGSILMILSIGLISWVLRANKFASKVVYKQEGQQLITEGPYSIVRHPFYTFMSFFSVGLPWMIGSPVWGLIASVMAIPVLMWRTYHEEEFLVEVFGQEYEQYRQDVPSRMFPGIF